MRKKMTLIMGIIICIMALWMPDTVLADSGPKPSVQINFSGIEGKTYYVTLLSKESYAGPHMADKVRQPADYMLKEYGDEIISVWKRFQDYEDEDGFFFLNYLDKCNEQQNFKWSYYPPDTFKVLIYFLEDDTFVSSEIKERYAFASYYDINISDGIGVSDSNNQEAQRQSDVVRVNNNYMREILAFFWRLIITLLVELIIAILFTIRYKRELVVIIITNICTQIMLNVTLFITGYTLEHNGFIWNYIGLEVLVIIIESIVYYIAFKKDGNIKGRMAIVYAIVANIGSIAAGMLL